MKQYFRIFLYSFCVRWFLRLFVGVRFKVADFLRYETQFIIVANHNSHLDTLTLLAALPASVLNRVRPVAARDHFGNTPWKDKLSRFFINAVLIVRDKSAAEETARNPIDTMLEALDASHSLILFPEGTRGEAGVPQPFKKGIGILLKQRPEVKYVPAYLKGMGVALPKNDPFLIPFNSSLTFGVPKKVAYRDVDLIVDEVESALVTLGQE